MHLKRQEIPKSWPVPRKAKTTYVVSPNFSKNDGMPLLVVLRDVLKVAENRKEVKKILHEKGLLKNALVAHDEKNNLVLFDTITFVHSKKSYRMIIGENGKFEMKEIKENEAEKKIAKIVDKKMLKGKKVQINLSDGRNLISNEKCEMGDSVLINSKSKKIEKILPLKEKAKVLIFEGKHAGEEGIVEKIIKEKKMIILKSGKNEISVLIKQVMATE